MRRNLTPLGVNILRKMIRYYQKRGQYLPEWQPINAQKQTLQLIFYPDLQGVVCAGISSSLNWVSLSFQVRNFKDCGKIAYYWKGSKNFVFVWYNKVYLQNLSQFCPPKNQKSLITNSLSGISVPRAGVEPARPCGHWCLRPTRLPIPPPGHISKREANMCNHLIFYKFLFYRCTTNASEILAKFK